ncbi:MAG: tRNA-dihydrouridine synthase family protein [Geobacteraceae bacterium]|nr:tRNA-dihydrouridine synthase family protein [Geobacteraceae bacterium]
MLAPMQGLTNRAVRDYFIKTVQPDTLFTEFMQVNAAAEKRRLTPVDRRDIASGSGEFPVVVQLVGHGREPLVAAAIEAQELGARHINLNMGCPYGRMTSGLTGGGMLKRPELLPDIIGPLRDAVKCSFSIKIRAGYDDPQQILSLLPLFESAGVDFIALHPRTVVQEYKGVADHSVTAEVVRNCKMPIIANGDIRTAEDAERVLKETGATGLMLGRGAIADPLLFARIRGKAEKSPSVETMVSEASSYLLAISERYREIFCGDMQVLGKLKAIVSQMDEDVLVRIIKELKRAKSLAAFEAALSR